MRILCLLLLILLTIQVYAQKNMPAECGAKPDKHSLASIQEAIRLGKNEPVITTRSVTSIPVQIWRINDSNHVESITDEMLRLVLQEANAAFYGAHLSFFQCGQPTYIVNEEFAEFSLYEETALRNQFYTPGLINLYVVQSLNAFNGTSLCGYAKFPGSTDIILMDADCLMDGSTFIHELGHFFGLYHTHGISNAVQTNELANGSNCTVAGDDVCDTPADPNLRPFVDNDCVYEGNALDQNGEPFSPDPTNLMSYAPSPCRNHFSEGQLDRIGYVHRYLRSYLSCSQLTADMQISLEPGICDDEKYVQCAYTGNISNATISWDITDDNIPDYFGSSFTHTYTKPGDHHITMFVDDGLEQISVYQYNAVQLFKKLKLPVLYHFDRPGRHQYLIQNPDQDQTWFESKLDPQTNNYCINIDNYHNYQRGEIDAFTLPPIELNGQTYAFLSFDVAYAYHGVNYEDQLEVLVSQDCGVNYERVFMKAGSDLATIPGIISSQWMPGSAQEWRNEYIDLTSYLGESILIQFRNKNDFGNNLYIDQITVDGDEVLAYEAFVLKGRKINDGLNRLQWSISNIHQLSSVWLEGSNSNNAFHRLHTIDMANENTATFDHRHLKGLTFHYRIAGIDAQGKVQYSNIISIQDASTPMLQLYPNPVRSKAMVGLSFEPELQSGYTYHILNHQGIEVQNGSGRFTQTFEEIPLSLDRLPSGVYFLILEVNGETYQQRFIKT